MNNEQLEYIIRCRIRDYENDIESCYEESDAERIKQDKVIIQELEKILTGKGLQVLSYI